MKIVELTPKNFDDSINLCIGSKPGFEQAREEKRRWLENHYPYGVGGKLAYYDKTLAGMLEYSPVEYAPFPVTGENLLHINCIWVLPIFQRKTIGENLLRAGAVEAKNRERTGLSVLAYDNPFFMPAPFFARQGFQSVQRKGSQVLMWKDLEPSRPPSFAPSHFSPEKSDRKVSVDVLCSAQCPWSIMTRQRIGKVSKEFHGAVRVRCFETSDRQTLAKLGESRKIFVNGNETFFIPPTEDDIRKVLGTSIRNLELGHRKLPLS